MRARVLKVESGIVHLGVYYQGQWLRVWARTTIPLAIGQWIHGELVFPGEGETLYFRIDEGQALEVESSRDAHPLRPGLDLEA